MIWPSVKVEAAFGSGPFAASKTWTNLTGRVRSVSAKHGRDQELGKFQTGNLGVTLDNSDRHLDPSHATGPYFGDLVPMVPVRARFLSASLDAASVADTFTRANSATVLGSAETGAAWTRLSFSVGAMGISSNQAYCSTVDGGANIAYQTGPADGFVEASFTHANATAANGLSLAFRANFAAFDAWSVQFASGTSELFLLRVAGGVPTTIDTTAFPAAATVLVRAEFDGADIRVLVDGVEVMSATDSTYATQTQCGFTINSTAPRVDGFRAGTMAAPIGYGYADGWPQEYSPPSAAELQLDCPDVFAVLANAPLVGGSPLTALIAADGPVHWYPLNDKEGASFFTDLGSDPVDGAAMGGATPGFGAAGIDAGDVSATAWQADGTDAGYLNTRLSLGTSWDTIVFLVAHDLQNNDAATRYVAYDRSNLVAVRGGVSAQGLVGFARNGDTNSRRTTVRVDDGLPHLIVARRVSDSTWTVYVDGVADAPTSEPPSGFNNPPATTTLGGAPDLGPANFIDGTLQHVAFFSTDKTGRATAYQEALGAWANETTGERITHILDAIGHPTAERNIDTGTITLGPAAWSESTRALGEIQAVEATEQGKLYQQPDGVITFDQRHTWITAARSVTSQHTFSDDPTEALHYERGITLDTGIAQIVNVVTVSWSGGTVVVKDQPSIDAYGPRDHQVATTAPSSTVARSIGEYLIDRYKDPILRVEKIILNPAATTTAMWAACMGLRVGDRVTVERHPQQVGVTIAQESIVEGIKWNLDDGINKATCTLTLSPADTKQYALWGAAGSVYDTALWA